MNWLLSALALLGGIGFGGMLWIVFDTRRTITRRRRIEAEQKRQREEWEIEFARRQEITRRAAKPRVAIDSRRVSASPIASARRASAPAPSPRRASSPAPAAVPASDDWVIPASLTFAHSRDESSAPTPAPAPSFSSGGGGDYSGGGASSSWGDSSSSSSCSSSDSSSSSSSSSSFSSD